MSILSHFQERYEAAIEEKFTLQQYLDICKNDPLEFSTTAERILQAIGESEKSVEHKNQYSVIGNKTPPFPKKHLGSIKTIKYKLFKRTLISTAVIFALSGLVGCNHGENDAEFRENPPTPIVNEPPGLDNSEVITSPIQPDFNFNNPVKDETIYVAGSIFHNDPQLAIIAIAIMNYKKKNPNADKNDVILIGSKLEQEIESKRPWNATYIGREAEFTADVVNAMLDVPGIGPYVKGINDAHVKYYTSAIDPRKSLEAYETDLENYHSAVNGRYEAYAYLFRISQSDPSFAEGVNAFFGTKTGMMTNLIAQENLDNNPGFSGFKSINNLEVLLADTNVSLEQVIAVGLKPGSPRNVAKMAAGQ